MYAEFTAMEHTLLHFSPHNNPMSQGNPYFSVKRLRLEK